MDFIWETVLLFFVGIFLLRISGRKSISQMTLGTTIVMISIGTIIVQPIIETSVIRTIIAASIFIVLLILLEFLQIKSNFIENIVSGKSLTVIENGKINEKNLNKLRLSVDQLEKRLRQKGVSSIGDIRTATLETNGQLGYELNDDAKPLSLGEFKRLMNTYGYQPQLQEKTTSNIFNEINQGHKQPNPDHLQ
jgi:uncharacterized membrane protein YcaP (DUF421 family)